MLTSAFAFGVLALAAQPIRPDHVLTLTPQESRAVRVLEERLNEYVLLHRRLEGTLPKLPKEATAEQLDAHEKRLAEMIAAARPDARPGEIFTRDVQELLRRAMAAVHGGSIVEVGAGAPDLTVNERYPDPIPPQTMPPQVLETLPKLGEGLEYRLAGGRIVLVDTHARLVVDVTEDVLPSSPPSSR